MSSNMEAILIFVVVAAIIIGGIWAAVLSNRKDVAIAAAQRAKYPEPEPAAATVIPAVEAASVPSPRLYPSPARSTSDLRLEIPFGQIFWPVFWAILCSGLVSGLLYVILRNIS